MISTNFIFVGFALSLIGSLSYVKDTLKGKTQPNRVTWFMWALAPLIAFAAQINEGVGIQSLLTFAVGFGPLLILLASFANSRSVWQITHFDVICGVLSLLGLLGWLVTRHGDTAIFFAIMADGLAAVPTLRKSWIQPESESSLVFLFASINATITLLTIQHFTFTNSAFAIYILALCATLFVLIRFKLGPRFSKRKIA